MQKNPILAFLTLIGNATLPCTTPSETPTSPPNRVILAPLLERLSVGGDGDGDTGRGAERVSLLREEWGAAKLDGRPLGNTTIAVVATDARLTKDQAQRLAVMAQDGLARAIRPVHAPFDGDVVFALSTERRDLPEPSARRIGKGGYHVTGGLQSPKPGSAEIPVDGVCGFHRLPARPEEP